MYLNQKLNNWRGKRGLDPLFVHKGEEKTWAKGEIIDREGGEWMRKTWKEEEDDEGERGREKEGEEEGWGDKKEKEREEEVKKK